MSSISVVIPTFNRLTLLGRALDSVLAQTRPADQIIVVDDGSSDRTAPILAPRYPTVTFIRQPHRGVSAARNTGINAATGEWIALLDSDDAWHHNKLERQMQALARRQTAYWICHSDEQWIRNGRRVNPMKKHRKTGGHIFRHCLERCVISPSAVVVHRRLFDECGLFDERLPACEDYDLWLRIMAHHPILFVNEQLLTKYGGHADQCSRQYWGMDRFRIRALDKLLSAGTLKGDDRTATIRALTEKINRYLTGAAKRGNQQHVNEFKSMLVTHTP